jgi:hypothetical protein
MLSELIDVLLEEVDAGRVSRLGRRRRLPRRLSQGWEDGRVRAHGRRELKERKALLQNVPDYTDYLNHSMHFPHMLMQA